MRHHTPNAPLALVLLVILTSLGLGSAARADAPAAPFFGRYEGRAIVEGDGVTTTRDLDVVIEPVEDAADRFRLTWSTSIRRGAVEAKRKSYTIVFKPSARPGIFASAMRTDMFGNAVPHDPMKGDPFVWCRIAGKVMTVYALLISDDGGYDLQIYERTLSDKGLNLKFTRLDEGNKPIVVTARLERADL